MPGPPPSTIDTTHSHWSSVSSPANLPNALGASTQNPRVRQGDTCLSLDVPAQYVCLDPTLNAAIWMRQENNQKLVAWNGNDLTQFAAIESFGGVVNPQATVIGTVDGQLLSLSMDLGSPVGAGAILWFNDPIEFMEGMDIRLLLDTNAAPPPVTPDNMLAGFIVAGPGPGGAGTGVQFIAGLDALAVLRVVQILVGNGPGAGFIQQALTAPATPGAWVEWVFNGNLNDFGTFPPGGIPIFQGTTEIVDLGGNPVVKVGNFLLAASGFAGAVWGTVPSNRVGIVWLTYSGITASATASLQLAFPSIDRFTQGRS